MPNSHKEEIYLRNLVFGIEDSLVSTVGLLTGIATGGVGTSGMLLTGTVLIFVEAFSMGVGSLLTENSVEEYMHRKSIPLSKSIGGALVMGVSYIVAGIIPLFPYMIWDPLVARFWSVGGTIAGLFFLGALEGKYFGIKIWPQAMRMMMLGGAAIGVGIAVARMIQLSA